MTSRHEYIVDTSDPGYSQSIRGYAITRMVSLDTMRTFFWHHAADVARQHGIPLHDLILGMHITRILSGSSMLSQLTAPYAQLLITPAWLASLSARRCLPASPRPQVLLVLHLVRPTAMTAERIALTVYKQA